MSGVNRVILVGRLGNDPEVKFLNGGQAVCNFSLATSENWVDKQGQKQERTEWHRIVAWAKLAEICGQYLSKGSQAYVEGKIQSRQYEAKDGTQRTAYDIVAQTVQFIGSKQQSGGEQSGSSYAQPQASGLSAAQQAAQSLGYNDGGADDVPF